MRLLIPITLCFVQQLSAQKPAFFYDPVWSPDGKQIAFYSNMHGEDYEVYIVNKDGTGLKQITDNEVHDSSPSWWAANNSILFTSKRDGTTQIYAYDLNSKRTQKVTELEGSKGSPQGSPDGEWILFESNKDGHQDIFAMRADGSDLKNLTNHPENDFRGSWSVDGKHIYFQSKRTGRYQLHQMNADGSGVELILESDNHQTSPKQIPGTSKLVYANYSDTGVDIYTVDLKTKQVEKVTDGFKDVFLPSFSPDGREIVFAQTKENGSSEIFIMNYKSREIRRLMPPAY